MSLGIGKWNAYFIYLLTQESVWTSTVCTSLGYTLGCKDEIDMVTDIGEPQSNLKRHPDN